MLNEICGYLNNWFENERIIGSFTVSGNAVMKPDGSPITFSGCNYFRIAGDRPTVNDGVYPVSGYELQDDTFTGAVWLMAVPAEIISLSKKIAEWEEKYGGIDSQALSPYASESFGGYSYSKPAGTEGSASWQGAFKSKLSRYRKL